MLPMRVFLDLEFTGLYQATTLISIGCVAEDGRSIYCEAIDYDGRQVNDWIQENVLAHLCLTEANAYARMQSLLTPETAHHAVRGTRGMIAAALGLWLAQWERVEVWGDCLAYDWMLFCELFGGAQLLPASVYYIPFDLATVLKLRGYDPDISREDLAGPVEGRPHNALHDAMVIAACVRKLEAAPRVEHLQPWGTSPGYTP